MSGRLAGQVGQLGHDLLHVLRACRPDAVDREGRALGVHDGDLVGELLGVVRADLGAEAVLQRRDDAAAVGVVLGIRAGHHVEVERQPHLVAADLDVALLHDVEEPDLDALGEIRQLVDGEDAPVRARQHPVVDGQLVAEIASLGHLDRIDLADEVGDGDVGRGQLLAVAAVAGDPHDRGGVALVGGALAARLADGRQRIVVDLAAGQGGQRLVEQADQHAGHPRLGLAPLAEEDQVLTAEDGVLDLGDDRVVVADDAGQECLAAPQARDEIVTQLLLDRLALPAAVSELPDGPCTGHERSRSLCGGGGGLSTLDGPRA